MSGLRKQTAGADEEQQQPPVVSASTAWRAHPPTADVRAARGVAGRFTPGSSGSSNGSSAAGEWEEPSVDEVEAEFWRIVEAAEEQVEALYGQDIDTATYCSAFPTIRVSLAWWQGLGVTASIWGWLWHGGSFSVGSRGAGLGLFGQDIDTATYCSGFPTLRVSQGEFA